jgi:tRNA pseudouridine55 synthase
VVVDKPAGMTSHDVVARLRRLLDTRRIGHAGTLDPMATGVLVCAVQRTTKLLAHLPLEPKVYRATVRLGMSTNTDDAQGDPLFGADASTVAQREILAAIGDLRGAIEQVPSTVSAVKLAGKRAYALARAGEQVVLTARPVTVSRFELLALRRGDGVTDLDVLVECSGGTYVRALARDLGAALGVGGHLTEGRSHAGGAGGATAVGGGARRSSGYRVPPPRRGHPAGLGAGAWWIVAGGRADRHVRSDRPGWARHRTAHRARRARPPGPSAASRGRLSSIVLF